MFLDPCGSSAAQTLRFLAQIIEDIETQRRTGEGILQPPVIAPFQVTTVKPSDWNTDGDVKADKLTGGAA